MFLGTGDVVEVPVILYQAHSLPLLVPVVDNHLREEVEHRQRLPETSPGSTQSEGGGALPDHKDPV